MIKGNSNIEYDFDQEELSSIRWFGLDEAPYDRTDSHMERFINTFKNISQQPVDQIL